MRMVGRFVDGSLERARGCEVQLRAGCYAHWLSSLLATVLLKAVYQRRIEIQSKAF